jgi:RND family efflux transporter MFP subunit
VTGTRAVLERRRLPLWILGAAVLAALAGVWRLGSGEAASESMPIATAKRGNLVVSVGGVGRIVQTRAPSEISISVGSSGSSSASGGSGTSTSTSTSATAPADAVFPRASGRMAKFFVKPGAKVVRGQRIAVLDDGGNAASAARLAQLDLRTALLELRQKRTSDPLKGIPATPAELAAGTAALTSAKARLARLLQPPRPADVSAVRLEIRRAQAELDLAIGGSATARADALRLAEESEELAEERLERILAPANPADIRAAELELKRAEADMATLQRPSVTPSPESLAAAQQAIAFALADLATAQRAADIEAIRAAQETLDDKLNDLAVLLRPGPTALPEQVAAAQLAIDAARAKLERLLAPPLQADVTAARVDLERAKADVRARKAGPSHAGIVAARQAITTARVKLAQLLGPPLRSDVTTAQLDVRKAQADLAVLRARGGPASPIDIGLSQLKVDAARARLASAEFARKLLTVRAPWNGVVTGLTTVRGAPVDPATPVVTVADLSRLSAIVDLSEFDAAQVRRGQSAAVSVDALGGKVYRGRVTFATPTGVNNGGVVIFPVQVGLVRTKGVKPGMNVSVRIVTARRNNVVQVPLEAISRDSEDRPLVTVISAEGDTKARRVRLGLPNNQNVEIVRGLRAGEQVVLPATEPEGEADSAEEAAPNA